MRRYRREDDVCCSNCSIPLSHVFYMALHVVNAGSFPRPPDSGQGTRISEAYRKGGDNHARDQLIEHNLRLVAHIIKKYYSSVRDQTI